MQEIAHSPEYMTSVDYIAVLIESEKQECKPGWKVRVQHLGEQMKLAQLIENAQDPNFDPFKKYREEKGGWSKYIDNFNAGFTQGLFSKLKLY